MRNSDHLTDQDVERLLHGQMPENPMLAAHQHLLTCRRCRVQLFTYDESLAGLHLDAMYGPGAAANWRRGLAAPIDTLSYLAQRSRQLEGFTEKELWFRVGNVKAFQDVGTVTALIERAYSLRKTAPRAARVMLSGAVDALKNRIGWPKKVRHYLLVRALAYLGNNYRVLNEFSTAEGTFKEARSYLAGIGRPAELAGLLFGLEGNLAKEQRQYKLAVASLKKALGLLPGSETILRVEAMITLANCYGEAGQLAASIATLSLVLEEQPRSAFPPGAFLAIHQSLVLSYAQTNQPEQAEALLPKVRRLAEEEGNLLDLVRVDWAEAEVHKAAGHRTLAAAGFRDVAAKFMAAQLPVDAALATLSQAEMYLELGDTKAAAGLAEALVPIFQSKGIHREATVAGLMVVEDLRREAATLVQVQGLVERLQGRAAAG